MRRCGGAARTFVSVDHAELHLLKARLARGVGVCPGVP